MKISASGPMPTSRYCDQTPCASSTSLSRAASGEPGRTARRLSPMTPTTAWRTASALLASPRACSSITRSSMLATNVTPEALTACRSQGASSQGRAGSRQDSSLLAITAWAEPSRLACPLARCARTRAAASATSSRSLQVGASGQRSYSPSGVAATSTGPIPGCQMRPIRTACAASSGQQASIGSVVVWVMVLCLRPFSEWSCCQNLPSPLVTPVCAMPHGHGRCALRGRFSAAVPAGSCAGPASGVPNARFRARKRPARPAA